MLFTGIKYIKKKLRYAQIMPDICTCFCLYFVSIIRILIYERTPCHLNMEINIKNVSIFTFYSISLPEHRFQCRSFEFHIELLSKLSRKLLCGMARRRDSALCRIAQSFFGIARTRPKILSAFT
jgi:hypothetical protein